MSDRSISDVDEAPDVGTLLGGPPSDGLVLPDRLNAPSPSAPALPAREPDPRPPWAPDYVEVPRPARCPDVWHFAARSGSQHEVPECWFCPAWVQRPYRRPVWPIGDGPPRWVTGPRFERGPRRLDPYAVAMIWEDPSQAYPYGYPWNCLFLTFSCFVFNMFYLYKKDAVIIIIILIIRYTWYVLTEPGMLKPRRVFQDTNG